MKNLMLWFMFIIILAVVVIFAVQAQFIFAVLFAVCDLLVLKTALKNKHSK